MSFSKVILFCTFIGALWPYLAVGDPQEVFWIQLKTNLDYEDALTTCKDRSSFFNRFDFVAEAHDNNIVRAELRSMDYRQMTEFDIRNPEFSPFFRSKSPEYKFPAPQVMPFTASEIGGLEFYRDKDGKLWLKKLSLSPRLIVWLLHPVGLGCKPSVPQTTAGPSPAVFDFELQGIMKGIPISYSALVPLTLFRWDGYQYHKSSRANLRFQQTERPPSMGGDYR